MGLLYGRSVAGGCVLLKDGGSRSGSGRTGGVMIVEERARGCGGGDVVAVQ